MPEQIRLADIYVRYGDVGERIDEVKYIPGMKEK